MVLDKNPSKYDRLTYMIQTMIQTLKKGGLIIYPTETAYALGCDATNLLAVNKVYSVKKRPPSSPLSILVADMEMAQKVAEMSDETLNLAKKHWPGPLTLICSAKQSSLAPGVIGPDNSIALRISSSPDAQNIVEKYGKPIVATSANASGQPTCYDIACVRSQIDTSHITAYDTGELEKNNPTSTIVDTRNELLVIRQGGIFI